MPKLKNINPLGDVDIVDHVSGFRAHVEAGAEFDAPADVAERLLEQAGNYEAVKAEKK